MTGRRRRWPLGWPLAVLPAVPVVAATLTVVVAVVVLLAPPPRTQASAAAVADIPPGYLGLYLAAATTCPGLPWPVLAAVGKVESDHGRSTAPGVTSGSNHAGAAGPMQFGIGGKAGNTWGGTPIHPYPPAAVGPSGGYGVDGPFSGDGLANVYDPADAIPAAATYLCDHGAGHGDLGAALLAYNHSDAYATQVLTQAAAYAAAPVVAGPDPAALLTNPRLTLTVNARYDLQRGAVDPRVVAVLAALLERHTLKVSVLVTGHSLYVAGTRTVSNHVYGRAVDIFEIDGQPVSRHSPAARAAAVWLLTLTGPLRPDELGSPFPELEQLPGAFSDAAHADHLHLGYEA